MIVSFDKKNGKKRVIVTVDETGDLGNKSRYFVYGATTLQDAEQFANIAKKYIDAHSALMRVPTEIGFSKASMYRDNILDELIPNVGRVYAVVIKKPLFNTTFRRKQLAKDSLSLLTDMVAIGNDSYYVDFIVDESSVIKNETLKKIVESNSLFEGSVVDCTPTNSKDSYELQANDYIIGSIGHSFEANDNRYLRKFRNKTKIKRVNLRK